MDGNGEKTPIFHVKVWFIIQMRQPIKSASLGCQGSIKIFRGFSQFESSVSPTGYPKHLLIKICFFQLDDELNLCMKKWVDITISIHLRDGWVEDLTLILYFGI